jgi:hypothetical protein
VARYHLHIRKGQVLECEDKDGAEFASLEDAYLEAFASAQELWDELLRGHHDPRQYTFVIAGADGAALTELSFQEVLESCHPVLPQPRTKVLPLVGTTKEAFLEAMANARRTQRLSTELHKELCSVRRTISALVSSPARTPE